MKKAAIFGLGYVYEQYYDFIHSQYEICKVVDSDCKKQGEIYHGVMCESPYSLIQSFIDAVIITPLAENIRMEITKWVREHIPNIEIIYVQDCIPKVIHKHDYMEALCYQDEFNNCVVFEEGVFIKNIMIRFEGRDNVVKIHSNVKIWNSLQILCRGNGNRFEVGEDTTIVSAICELSENGVINIGKDCMLSWDIDIFQNAFHPIFDLESGKRMNVPKDIIVGNHVWVGKSVGLLAGCEIGDGCIVGYGSVVSKKYKNNVTIAGVPAKVIQEMVCWKRDVTGYYPLHSLDNVERYR